MFSRNFLGKVAVEGKICFLYWSLCSMLIFEGEDGLFNQMSFILKLLEMHLFCGAQVCFLEFFPWYLLVFLSGRPQYNIYPSQPGNPSDIESSS